ncbi:MAG: TetR/AcrR family transcriptional regulator C-terminal domain-containing protein [Firmicutes bacterium]|nr:TetR/AcrR family transcriptional regulator C-terminal domain-containing protein [Bacillota bacterium]
MSASDFTEKMIIEAFKELLNKKNFNKITVKDIVDSTGISRNTFYYHFQDITDLAQKTFEKETMPLYEMEISNQNIENVLMEVTQLAKESRRTIYHIYNNVDRARLEKYLYKMCNEVIRNNVDRVIGNRKIDKESIEFLETTYTCAVVGLIIKWIDDGMPNDIELLIKKYSDLFLQNLEFNLQSLENCTN